MENDFIDTTIGLMINLSQIIIKVEVAMSDNFYGKYSKTKLLGITPIILILLVFVFAAFFMSNSIRKYNYSLLEKESLRLTKSYSNNLEIAIDAKDITTNLMDDRIKSVGIAIANMGTRTDFTNLQEIGTQLGVDVIYLYSMEGIIVESSDGLYVGWQAAEDHPVHDFYESGEIFLVEDIRADTESGIQYKYGYYRLEDGRFIQIGILAEKIQMFLNTFDIQLLMEEMFKEEDILNASFYDKNSLIIASSEEGYIGKMSNSQVVIDAINSNLEISNLIQYNGENSYQVLSPVTIEGEVVGALSIIHSLESTNSAINDFILLGLTALFIIFALIIIYNITTLRNNNRLHKMAFYDPLTDLPNRQSLLLELNRILRNRLYGKALLLININDFKSINMTYGYEYGDDILKIISKKLKERYVSDYRLFRFASDRFVVIVNNYNDREELENKIIEIINLLEGEFFAQGQRRTVEINMGVVEINNSYEKSDEIIRDATIAVSYVDGKSSLTHAFYNNVMLDKIQREETIESEIIAGLVDPKSDKLYLVFQPMIDTKTKKIVGFEALTRLKTDTLGYISPVEFIEIAEKRHLISRLGEWIFESAILFLKNLEYEGYGGLKISINVSGDQLTDPSFKSKIIDKIVSTRINPKNVTLEVTESVLFENYQGVNKTLKNLRQEGIAIALDDFGTGYSSFSRLRELNIDSIKLDKAFIDNIGKVRDDNLLSGDIISLGHRLGLLIVAEGVETKQQVEYLENRDCDVLQGFYYSKPLEMKDAIKFLEKQL